ncbi:hypothetical protein [Streptosporangium sp. KLBMP 9127]|nr:hypothetical protein [Streptosporangium sp. KLBMP 9127]
MRSDRQDTITPAHKRLCSAADLTVLRPPARRPPMVSACHVFLASTVTVVGWQLLAFTLYEGLICAFLRLRSGVIAALAHGIAIFLLAGALI